MVMREGNKKFTIFLVPGTPWFSEKFNGNILHPNFSTWTNLYPAYSSSKFCEFIPSDFSWCKIACGTFVDLKKLLFCNIACGTICGASWTRLQVRPDIRLTATELNWPLDNIWFLKCMTNRMVWFSEKIKNDICRWGLPYDWLQRPNWTELGSPEETQNVQPHSHDRRNVRPLLRGDQIMTLKCSSEFYCYSNI